MERKINMVKKQEFGLDIKSADDYFNVSPELIEFTKSFIEQAKNDFNSSIENTIKYKLRYLGFVFNSDKELLEFVSKRITHIVNSEGYGHYIYLDEDLEGNKNILLISYNDKPHYEIDTKERKTTATIYFNKTDFK